MGKKHAQTLSAQIRNLSVLLVDDDEFILDFIADMLEDLSLTHITRATSGEKALAYLAQVQTPPDLIVCDLQMPGVDGVELLRWIAESRFPGAIVVSSGMDTRIVDAVSSLVNAHGLRMLGVLQKPLQEQDLLRLLSQLVVEPPIRAGSSEAPPLSIDEIREALAEDRVEVFVQPKVSVQKKLVLGVECLARLRCRTGDIIPPVRFVPVLESHGLIGELSLTIFGKALDLLATWTLSEPTLKLAVNLSVDDIRRADLPEMLIAMVAERRLDPGRITLEITESQGLTDFITSLEVLSRLRLRGFGLSIDDFGTGFSTMETLKRLPFTEIKIDRAFVHGAKDDKVQRAILESSAQLGRALRINIVAEGIETEDDFETIYWAGCYEAQGYYISRPMPASEFLIWKADWDTKLKHGD
uniref:EAL domain-containing response regulator n=1 Tax=Sulfuriferula sp. GW6 TaxID=3345112 RepID=UPI0039F69BFA